MQNEELAISKLIKYNQGHIINTLNSLDGSEKKDLINQIIALDFEEIERLYNSSKTKKKFDQSQISPLNCIIDKEKIENKEDYIKIGEDIIKNNQYAVVLMAGRTRNKNWI